ncbi:MAG TPA: hypothetical protein VM283_09905 [Armatimonadota bacterium]|nr:hypothetical protein [Armatimonadota bacterium]
MKATRCLMVVCLALLCPLLGCAQEDQLTYRWFYLSTNFLVPENVAKGQALLQRAAAVGYSGVVLTDSKFGFLDQMPDRYFDNVRAFKATADELGLEIVPGVMPIGYSGSLLYHNPNLAEGPPVKDALFVVRDRMADLVADPPVALPGGDFEQATDHKFAGWDWQDNVGESIFADTQVVHGGSVACRMEAIGAASPEHGHCRLSKLLDVSPFRCYHLQAWVKSEDFDTADRVRIFALSPDGRALSYIDLGVKRTQDWTLHHVVFNSLDNQQVRVYIGVWGGRTGKLWWDDVTIEEVGLLNLLRRDGCPLTVRGEDGTVYEEGRDFEPVKDERMGVVRWSGSYELYHEPPVIQLIADSRIADGQRLRVSFYQPAIIGSHQVTCCLSEPQVYQILDDQIRRIEDLLHPSAWFMSHDEIRCANWCQACQDRAMTPGQLLADNVRRCTEIIRAINPDARIGVWSDMFDPYHNAHDNYYLVNGTWEGSWEGLDPDVIIADWYFKPREQNLPWFAGRGHKQILAGYYDNSSFYTPQWLADAQRLNAPVIGVIYTTWRSGYDDLERWAQAVWGGAGH